MGLAEKHRKMSIIKAKRRKRADENSTGVYD